MIYDCDLCLYEQRIRQVVQDEFGRWWLYNLDNILDFEEFLHVDFGQIEILGNSFENPELIEVNKK